MAFNERYNTSITHLPEALKILSNNYTIYLVSFDEISLEGSLISAPRIGLCAPNINSTKSVLDAANKGCSPPDGLGMGGANETCPGAGGSHGGKGGYGSTGYGRRCDDLVSKPYFYEGEAKFEGSPGGRGN